MIIICLECNFITGFLLNLPFHYKEKHKDKVDVCICGDYLLSGFCIDGSYTEITGVASKCSNSSSICRFSFRSNCFSNIETLAKPNSNIDAASDPGSPTLAKPKSKSNSNSSSISNSNSSSNSNTNSSSKSNSSSNSSSNSNSISNSN